MKNITLFLTACGMLFACSKNDNGGSTANTPPPNLGKPYTLPSAPKGNPAYDDSELGIYKGVTINAGDSTATFQFNIANNDERIYALEYTAGILRDSMLRYVVDSNTYLLAQPLKIDSSAPPPSGQAYYTIFNSYLIYGGPGNAWAQLGLKANGDPTMNVNLRANQTLDAILKERSDNQVFCFEGTYAGTYLNNTAGPDNGLVSLVINADTAILIIKSIAHPQFFPAAGAAAANGQFSIPVTDGPGGADFIMTGSVTGNTISGTWIRQNSSASGTFTAQRTL